MEENTQNALTKEDDWIKAFEELELDESNEMSMPIEETPMEIVNDDTPISEDVKKLALLLKMPEMVCRNLPPLFIQQAIERIERLHHNMEALRSQIEEIQNATEFDELTETLRRKNGEDRLRSVLENMGGRRSEKRLTIAFIDVDGLKQMNDSQSHEAGDTLLKEVTAIIKGSIRPTDFIFRYGGDEFVCVLPDTNQKQGMHIFGRIAEKIAKSNYSISVGITEFIESDSAESVIHRADTNLYLGRMTRRIQKYTEEFVNNSPEISVGELYNNLASKIEENKKDIFLNALKIMAQKHYFEKYTLSSEKIIKQIDDGKTLE